ncbi:hypothetical protein DENSPDRAFT_830956 [Dentipellis sp. KUC8613]|nr:hypothetical protein DENSPDRAFT_830956 [Dentipellis sp. KUC8613]
MSENQELLNILQAHGQEFLASFGEPSSSTKKRKINEIEDAAASEGSGSSGESEESGEDEWLGFGSEEDGSDGEDGEDEEKDDGFTAGTHTSAPVVVFSDARPQALPRQGKGKNGFMSSKVSKLRRDEDSVKTTKEALDTNEDERTNIQNDALLHRLVHTQLLSGSLNPELNLTSAQKKKALAGRIMELSGKAKLGKGEKAVREKERNRAFKRVREGIIDKQADRRAKQLEEAKSMGNYHPTIKKLFEESSEGPSARKREKGLGMGVGKFSDGILKLSRKEINSVQGLPRDSSGRGRGRGQGRGRGSGYARGGGRGRGRS